MVTRFKEGLLLLWMASTFYACFKEDTPIEPVSRQGIRITHSMYDYQSFYDLSSDSVYTNPNDQWDLAFESAAQGWHIWINYSSFLGIYRTGSTDFNATSYRIIDKNWLYDASSGNPDSTAIGNWNEVTGEDPPVYILGSYDGVRYKPFLKLRFLAVTDTSYIFSFAALDNSGLKEVTIAKDSSYNHIYYSLSRRKTVRIEPPKNQWDILFTQYVTTLFTNEGLPIPYIVRGVYMNKNVEAMVDSVIPYRELSAEQIDLSRLSPIQDYIGYNWKSVEINQSANTARYAVRKNYSYIIKDTQGNLYKLHFLSYVNDSLRVGYPMFEKVKLK
jgi:hypothetical protein